LEILNFLIDEFFINFRPKFSSKIEQYFFINQQNDKEIVEFGNEFAEFYYKKMKTKIEPSIIYENFSKSGIISNLLFTCKRMKLKNYEKLKNPNKRQLFMRFVYSTPSDLYYYFLEKNMKRE
jgi:hypothetical protein